MKRNYFLMLVFSISIMTICHSQTRMGLKFNYSIGTASENTLQLDNPLDIINYDLKFKGQDDVISMGLSTRKEMGPFYLQADFLYRKTGYGFEMKDYRDRRGRRTLQMKNDFQMINIPVHAGFKIKNVSLGAGPLFNFILDKNMAAELDEIFEIHSSDKHYGFQFVLGLKAGKHILLEAKYENVFTSVTDAYYYNDHKINIKTSPNLISLGIAFYL